MESEVVETLSTVNPHHLKRFYVLSSHSSALPSLRDGENRAESMTVSYLGASIATTVILVADEKIAIWGFLVLTL